MPPELSPTLRVLWLIDSLALGGAESLALSLARFQARTHNTGTELDLGIIALKSALPGLPQSADGDRSVQVLDSRGLRDRAALNRLQSLVAQDPPDLIHAHLTDATIWAEVVARRSTVPFAVSLHVEPTAPAGLGPLSAWLRRLLERRALRRATGVAGVSEAVIESWKRNGRLRRPDVALVPSGIDVERFRPPGPERRRAERDALEIAPDALVITTVAVLRRGKGVETLLTAMQPLVYENPKIQLLIVGSGPEDERLRIAAEPLGDRVRFLGARPDVPEILAASDLFVLASESEALPTVVLEAMAAGLPVVASRVGGIPEALAHGECGLLVPVGSQAELSNALRQLISDPERRSAVAMAARKRAQNEYSLEAWRRRLFEWYLQLVGETEVNRRNRATTSAERAARQRLGASGS